MYNELAHSPFVQNGGPLLILFIIAVWFLAKEPIKRLWEKIRQLLSPPDQ